MFAAACICAVVFLLSDYSTRQDNAVGAGSTASTPISDTASFGGNRADGLQTPHESDVPRRCEIGDVRMLSSRGCGSDSVIVETTPSLSAVGLEENGLLRSRAIEYGHYESATQLGWIYIECANAYLVSLNKPSVDAERSAQVEHDERSGYACNLVAMKDTLQSAERELRTASARDDSEASERMVELLGFKLLVNNMMLNRFDESRVDSESQAIRKAVFTEFDELVGEQIKFIESLRNPSEALKTRLMELQELRALRASRALSATT